MMRWRLFETVLQAYVKARQRWMRDDVVVAKVSRPVTIDKPRFTRTRIDKHEQLRLACEENGDAALRSFNALAFGKNFDCHVWCDTRYLCGLVVIVCDAIVCQKRHVRNDAMRAVTRWREIVVPLRTDAPDASFDRPCTQRGRDRQLHLRVQPERAHLAFEPAVDAFARGFRLRNIEGSGCHIVTLTVSRAQFSRQETRRAKP